ncbi:MAG TPA: arginase family protein [Bacteroidota bacterium]|nr:arginase family protein [Bacteroidota bacterium]
MVNTLSEKNNFLGIEKLYSSLETSRVTIVPAPYEENNKIKESTGTSAILKASRELPLFDEETKRELYKEIGIATISPLSFEKKHSTAAIEHVYNVVYELLQLQKFVVLVGGSHCISSAAIAAHAKYFPRLSVLHFSAYSDLQKSHRDTAYNSSSTMSRVLEILDPTHLVQVGIRYQTRDEAEVIREKEIPVFYAHNIRRGDYTRLLKVWDDYVVENLTEQVFVDIDLSVFDPSLMPAVALPQPYGLLWDQVLQCIRKVVQKRTIIGCSIVGLTPIKGLVYPEITAAKLITKILNYAL